MLSKKITYPLCILLLIFSQTIHAQNDILRNVGNKARQIGSLRQPNTGGTDSLHHRNKLEDSITINFRYLDSTRSYRLDSSVDDFTKRFPIPATHIYLGNNGTATHSLLFSPVMSAGFDPGFHAFDVYTWKLDQVRFFNTTRPYSELDYMLGSRSEQVIGILHTQNIKPDWNFLLQYRLINSPGFFKNQKTNHNNYLLSSRFQSRNRRYSCYLVLLANSLQSAENGGIVDTTHILDDPIFKNRFNISTHIGGDDPYSSNFFITKVNPVDK